MSPKQSLFDDHEIHEVAPLVTSSSLDSTSSTGTVSPPTSLIPDPSLRDVRSSLGLSHGTRTVKFAPLPQIDPNRKRFLAPVGVSARSRRKRVIQQEDGSFLWSTDPDVSEDMQDPVIAFARFIKKAGKTLWRRVRQGSKAVSRETVSYSVEPVLDINSTLHAGDMIRREEDQRVSEVVDSEDERGHRASWSPLPAERRTLLGQDTTKRKSSNDIALPPAIA